ncbi:VWA domain-containing protein [Cytobacillus sp. FJAT-54145]|uniref:VWA domain-containing protein n=1 Tax=Cytobacillus spartinae TaxID=3299023 RepID=A0ABW6KI42_9BACI
MKSFKHLLVVLSTIIFILVGCKQDEQKNVENNSVVDTTNNEDKEKNEDPEEEEKEANAKVKVSVDPLPSTYQELAARPVGEYHDFSFLLNEEDINRMLETFSDLPDVSKQPTNEELDYFYQELLAKVQKDFIGPEDIISRLRFQAMGSPEMEDSRYQFKENLNVLILLDASGSMKEAVNGKPKMDAAKDAIKNFVKQLPEEANIAIRVYGHKGSGSDIDKNLSCTSSEIVYPLSTYNPSDFDSALNTIQPSGWTPIELAINEAKKDLSTFNGEDNTNIVYLVSDGISTCDDNPIRAAKELYNSNISPIINVIGFDIDSKGQNQMRELVKATEGIYASASDENELVKELSKLNDLAETWKKWRDQGKKSIELEKLNNGLEIFSYIAQEESKNESERTIIYLILSQFWQNELLDVNSRVYLEEKNNQYHFWIREEIERFNDELKALNDISYTEAIKALEEKYEQNTQ